MINWVLFKYKVLILKLIIKTSGRLSKYPNFVLQFEKQFATDHDCEYGVTYCNGSSAIEAALFAVGVQKGDEVLVSTCSVHSTAMSIISLEAQPVYVDIEADSLNFDPEEIDRKVTDNTVCLIVVHLWGNPADMIRIRAKAKKYNLKIVEDCSHAHGATINGQKVGSWGDVGCFSLQGYKAVSAAEGGIAITNNKEYHNRLSLYGHFGRNKIVIEKSVYRELLATGIGTKRRANPLGINMAAVDLKYLDKKNKLQRKAIDRFEQLTKNIATLDKVTVVHQAIKGGFYPGHPVVVKPGVDKQEVLNQLKVRLKRHALFGRPYFFKVPDPHYHQMKHMNDLDYGASLKNAIDEPPLSVNISIPKLETTESVLERIIFIPIR
jgi:dTDP-4-amino-4,6-dideoxygalactose transaminase